MLKRFLLVLIVMFGVGLSGAVVEAQRADTVYAVLFYSPTCPHCHELITTDLPPIQEQFGDQLMIFFIDVSTDSGSMLAQSAYAHYEIPRDRWVVPMMIVNEQVLIGGVQIPTELPIITQAGIENGGIAIPQFPLMQQAFEQWQAANEGRAVVQQPAQSTTIESTSNNPFTTSFEHDPLASILTLVILVTLIVSVGALIATHKYGLPMIVPQVVIMSASLVTLGLVITILFADQQRDDLAFPIATVILIGIMLSSGLAVFGERVRSAVSLLTLVGLAISVYMAYIELTTNPAVCGAIGDCNAVQQSDYAHLLGIPIGVIGVMGYLLMLGISLMIVRGPERYLSRSLWMLQVLVGVSAVFTIYLTFLEPFVIGAVCAWCLMSSLVVLNLLWLVMPMVRARKVKPIQYLLYQPR